MNRTTYTPNQLGMAQLAGLVRWSVLLHGALIMRTSSPRQAMACASRNGGVIVPRIISPIQLEMEI